ncbi:MAG: hypothetical protein CL696_06325 [Chloroflexi bacterium]|jgi:hypothetical protein|nr:hypothetical protein [Chloroflexota bacterium]MDP7588926.1 hypothetical protein [Dehalococcoidia bacterium]MQF89337.1 hypothetical protein [SAR202 cluster bacterium]MQG10875.1 hypothetical protein [SAR202 cluster bacterium]|tara:strand:- start:2614 stop:2952 length:339 start_codon:yes stop_codon:yes gene_type:complete
MVVDQYQRRIDALETKVVELATQLDQRTKEMAYMYIHSNWTLIRWYLTREQDRSGEGSETYIRAKNAETLIDRQLTRNLRDVHFEPQAMDVAYRWRIETTVTLTQNGYTFFD